MKLTLDANQGVNLIRSYSSTEVRVGETILQRSCIITPDTIIADWRPSDIDDLVENDLQALLATQPALVLLGTGATHRFASAPIRGAFVRAGVALETMDQGAACRTFRAQASRPSETKLTTWCAPASSRAAGSGNRGDSENNWCQPPSTSADSIRSTLSASAAFWPAVM